MNLSKKTEQEIRQVYQSYWDAYLTGDFKTFASFMVDDIVIYGTAVGEIFYTKEAALEFYTATAAEMTGKAEFRNRDISIQPVGNTIVIYEQSQLFILIEETWTYYGYARITGIFEQKENSWKLVHQHGSFPDSRTEEGQQIASEKIKEENLQLREAVQRRTVELENKTRELGIEASLERVRTAAMSMRKHEDMLEVCRMISEQLEILDVQEIRNVQTAIFYPDKGVYINYEYYRLHQKSLITEVDYKSHPIQENFADAMMMGKGEMVIEQLTGMEVRDWVEYQATTPQFVDPHLYHVSSLHYYWYALGPIALGMSTYAPLTEAEINLFKRFRNVFDLAYRRYLDIEQAEAQAREAQIEAALERIRSRTMAMQKSDELKEVIQVVYDQFVLLKINIEHTGFIIDYKERSDMHIWLADIYVSPFQITIPYFDSPHWNSFVEAKNKGGDFFSNLLDFEEKNKFYTDLFKLIPGLPEESQQTIFSKPGLAISTVLLDNVGLYIENFSGIPYSDEENNTLMRFGTVFQQTYTRFLDLQKAEAQTREAQIEAALERVRSRSLAMHHTADLQIVIHSVHQELLKLNLSISGGSFIVINSEIDNELRCWGSGGTADTTVEVHIPLFDKPFYTHLREGIKSGPGFFTEEYTQEEKIEFFTFLFKHKPWSQLGAKDKNETLSAPGGYTRSCAVFQHTSLFIINHFGEKFSEPDNAILQRFGKVFDQSYTRFLDLQKAEAQAREARIEASLERVRSVALGMRKAVDLLDICEVLYTELEKLEFSGLRNAMINILDDHTETFLNYDYSPLVGKSITLVRYDAQAFIENQVRKLKASNDAFVEDVIEGPLLKELIALRLSQGEVDDPRLHSVDVLTYYFYSIGVGAIGISSFNSLTEDQRVLLRRFRNVFEFAYRRYMDIAQAEAQAREAKIEAGLERVRSRTMAMQSCDELSETASVVLHELVKLGISPNRLYIAIIENDNSDVHFYLTNEEGGKDCSVYTAKIENNISVRKMYEGWATHQSSITLNMEGQELAQYFRYLRDDVGVPFKNLNFPSRRVQTIAYFSQGYIGIASQEDQPDETTKLLERFAAVFNLTYTRFNDLKQAEKLAHQATLDLFRLKEEKARTELALTELKAAQAQLIQSEKMASLGELTAGIAHEIQNPLNFVNNFSDVNTELIEEMKEELALGNTADAIAISNDIADNEQKINHHGKRADAIVKGMLMHSRTSGGVKEPTDINTLADEYLRLAYHGLRAKDKSFNATMKTDFDNSIGMVNVIPQDIGRVILNLITNAFYAVSDKAKMTSQTPYPLEGGVDFEPLVLVSTKLQVPLSGGRGSEGAMVIISVRDNGPGIPQHILDKIFQPFFTTKPTGQGTGLGLSLSYDIVKAHGGELKVETKEGDGTVFTIQLPIS